MGVHMNLNLDLPEEVARAAGLVGSHAADRAKFLLDYRKEMVRLLERSLRLETALLDGQQEAAQAALEELRGMEDPAHERFTEEEK